DKAVHHIEVAAPDGVVVAATDREGPSVDIGESVAAEEFFIKGKAGATITDIQAGHLGKAELAVSAPIMSRDRRRPIGVIINFMELLELNSVLSGKFSGELGAVSWGRGRHKTMEVYLVNKDKFMITESIFNRDAVLNQVVDTPPVNMCLSEGTENEGFYTGYRGVEVAGASMCLPSLGWTLLVEVGKDEVLAPISHIKAAAIISGVVLVVLMGLLFIFLYRHVVRNILTLTKAADEIAMGNYGVAVPVTSGDEVGSLTESFNRMAKEIMEKTSALEKSGKRLTEAQRIAKIGSWEWHSVTKEMYWTDEVYRIFGFKPHEVEPTIETFLNSVHPDDRERIKGRLEEALRENIRCDCYFRAISPGESDRFIHGMAGVAFNGCTTPVRVVGTFQDVTEHRKMEAELRKLSSAIDQSTNIMFITDSGGVIEYVNPAFTNITGYSKEEALGKNPRLLSSGETPKPVYEELWKTIKAGNTWRGVFKNKKKTGESYWANEVILPVRDETGAITGFLAMQEDITERMAAEEKMRRLVSIDTLTGLLNRARFIEMMDAQITRMQAGKQPATLLLIDIDRFQTLNDIYGHGFGDEAIRQTARLIDIFLKQTDDPVLKESVGHGIIGRLSGDEFAVFLPFVGGEKGAEAAEHLRMVVKNFRFMEIAAEITVSIGIAFFPGHGTTTKELMTKADAAMFSAKEQGRNRCHIYSKEERVLEDMHLRHEWKGKIMKALEDDRFEAWVQPILALRENTVRHYEVLARIRGEDGSIFTPAAFIETAERFGIVDMIDRVITEKAMRLQAESARRGRPMSFCVNLSGKSIGDPELLAFIGDKLLETGATPGSMIFEITETAAVSDIGRAKRFIEGLKSFGCLISLDDFGVGFTSFLYLRELNVDYIKIDGFFIRKLGENAHDQLFVKAMAEVARGLGIKTVAEFVENKESLELIKIFGVDYGQGYLIGKPEPPTTYN
ncbi:MAG: EAL domain-containing protein, partial [Deltaproteobacteria bacterium]|nr:EAL domain-containing protein [Deltaproteobacteria bacterium]